jgi:hypothetical protein
MVEVEISKENVFTFSPEELWEPQDGAVRIVDMGSHGGLYTFIMVRARAGSRIVSTAISVKNSTSQQWLGHFLLIRKQALVWRLVG